jgi:hypothetical protein
MYTLIPIKISIFRNANWKSGIWTNGLYNKGICGIKYLMVNGLAK